MSEMMRRVKLVEPQKLTIERVEIPKPASGEALIKVKACGVCGTDLHAYRGEHPFISCPIVLGHEFSGIMVETGKHVVVEPSLVCGECHNCKTGRYNICENLRVIGCQTDGAFAEYIAVPSSKVFPIPDDIPFEEAALVEPAAVGVHAVEQADLRKGNRVVIIGSGTVGLMVLQAAKAFGAGETIITDVLDPRLELARELGADYAINAKETDPVRWIHDTFGRDGIDKVFECVGGSQSVTVNQAIQLARKGTRIVVVGVFERKLPVEIGLVQDRELELVGSLMYKGNDFSEAIDLIHKGKINAKRLISKIFPLEKAEEAIKLLEKEKGDIIKIVLKP